MRGHLRYRSLRSHSAKLFVVDGRENCRMLAAHRTLWIPSQIEFAKFYPQRIKMKKTSDEGFADAQNQFQCLDRLQHSDNSRQNSKHSRLRAVRNGLRRRRLGEKAAIARPAQMRREESRLALKTEYRAIDIRLARKNADV